MKKIAVSIAHYPERPGFKYNQLTEYGETVLIAAQVVHLLHTLGQAAHLIGSGPLPKKVAEINAGGFDCGMEIHLNAGRGNGCETLYCPGSLEGINLATAIQDKLVERCGFRDRGIKQGWYKMDRPGVEDYPGDIEGDEKLDWILWKTNCPFVIIEPFFLDGPDGEQYAAQPSMYLKIASAIAEGITHG